MTELVRREHLEYVSRLDSVESARRRLPPGNGDVAAAAQEILSMARAALADLDGSAVAVLVLTTATEVQAAEVLALQKLGRVRATGGKWTFRLWNEVDND